MKGNAIVAMGVKVSVRPGRRRAALAGMLMMTTALGGLAAPAPALAQSQSADRSFDIPAQSLGEALTDFGQQSGLQVSVDSAAIRGVSSPGVSGTMPAAQALSRLLTGTGFTFRIDGAVVTLERAPQSAGGAIQLGPVRVEGAGGGSPLRHDPAATEGTGSYTTRAMNTATKMPLSIRETPQSITVITSQVIEDKQIDDLADVVEQTAGLSISRYESNRGSMFARGFRIESYLLDGVPTSINEQWSAGEILSNMAMLDRVEVLRGSDGLMVGTGNPSAVINMVRKRANSDVLAGSLAVEGGSWSHFGATADIGVPITGSTRVRLVADFDRSGSYVDRLENESYTLYGTVEQDIGEHTLLSAGISYQDNRTDSPTWGGVPAWTVNAANEVIPLDLGRSFNPAPNWAYWNVSYLNAFARIEHDFGNDWIAKASYTRGERDSESKLALYYPYPIDPANGKSFFGSGGFKFPSAGYAGIYSVQNDKDDVNVQLNGKVRLLGGVHDVIFGFDWWKEKSIDNGAPGGITLALTPSVAQFDPDGGQPTFISPANNYNNNRIEQRAFFAAARISLAEPIKLIGGARLIDYRVTDLKTSGNSFEAKDKIVPYVGAVVSPIENLSLYASYTTIFEPQRFLNADGAMLPPIEGNTYETGIKGELFDGRLTAALSLYRMEQKNVAQVQGLVPIDPAFPNGPKRSAYIAVDGVVSKGFEVEVTGEILPEWNVTAGYSLFSARQRSGADISPLIPRQQFNLFTTYRLPGALSALTLGGGVRWQSETSAYQALAAALGVPPLKQEAYLVADLMARYQITEGLSAQLNIKNLFDKKYFAPTEDVMQLYWQEPLNAQLRVKYQF